MSRIPFVLIGLSLPLLAACVPTAGGFDFGNRGSGISPALETPATAPRPEPDANGLITYPNYQVAIARRGDTVTTVANRIGIDPDELARFNGRPADDLLRPDEVLALPRRVTPPDTATAAPSGLDITAIASSAIDRADAQSGPEASPTTPETTSSAPTLTVQGGREPVRHRVQTGETAYSIARLYGVSVRALADWNGLDSEFTVRERQFLMIPIVLQDAPPTQPDSAAPGQSVAPLPPSSSQPLPAPIETVEAPAAPDLSGGAATVGNQPEAPQTTPSAAPAQDTGPQFIRPLDGRVVTAFGPGREGIDIAGSSGATIRAAADGEVAAITRDTDQIPILVIRHPGNLMTIYANIQNISVERGDQVSAGQSIASLGDSGTLHFEVRRGFQSVDPEPFFQ